MSRVFFDQEALRQLCRCHGVRRLSRFGSVLKGTARPDSDVDLLIEFEPGAKASYFKLAEIETELTALPSGRGVTCAPPRN